MKAVMVLLSTVLLMATTGVCYADDTGNLSKENIELKQRVEKLEKELAELKSIVMQQVKTAKPQQKYTAELKPKKYDTPKISTVALKQPVKKNPVWSNLDIQLYGYIKGDVSYDSSRTTPGNYVVWADSDATNKNDNEFNMTANQTRLGMLITGPQNEDARTSGRVEIDFYGSGAPENKAKIQMRHAYLKIDWPQDNFSIIAGQTSDVMSPLNPSTLNYTVLWDAGNIGYRRTQIRLTKNIKLSSDVDMKVEAAIARTIGRSNTALTPTTESGEDAGYPGIQARTSLTFPWFGFKPTTVGVSGHWAKEEYDTAASGVNRKFDSWSVNIDLTQPINKSVTIKGEFFTGRNLDSYFGGIGQGVNTDTTKTIFYQEIPSTGGWIAAGLGPCDKWRFNLGVGVDDVDPAYVNAGDRTLNRSIFGNAIYEINKSTEVGFELSQWHTERKSQGSADNLRAQMSFIYKF